MDNFCKRSFSPLRLSKIIYTFYDMDDSKMFNDLKLISDDLSNMKNCWSIKCCSYTLPISDSKILQKIDNHYHKYNKHLDKLCIITKNDCLTTNIKLIIKHFQNINSFTMWLKNLKIL